MNKRQLLFSVLLLISCAILACNSGTDTKNNISEDSILTAPVNKSDTSIVSNKDSLNLIVDLIKKELAENLVSKDTNILTDSDRRFSYSEVDLDEDGKNEILVAMKGSYFCGNAGCTVFLLDNHGTKISGFTIVDGPVVIANSKTKNWSDLIIQSRGVKYLVKFDGKKYPGNPSIQPKFDGNIPADLKVVLPNDAAVYIF